MSEMTGASAVLSNLRKRMPADGHNKDVALSTIMANVSLSSFIPPKKGVAIASFKLATVNPSTNSVMEGINSLFRGELSAVPGSLKVMEKTKFYTTVSAHLVRNTVTRPVTVDGKIPQGFVSLSKNIFMEERDSKTWKLITTDEGKKILVRDNTVETDADMQKLLSSLSSVGHQYTQEAKRMTALASNVISNLDTGVLVSFVANSEHQLGFVVNPMDSQGDFGLVAVTGPKVPQYRMVAATNIVNSYDFSIYGCELQLPKLESHAAANIDVNFLVDYYKKVYGYNAEYFQKFLEKVNSNGMV